MKLLHILGQYISETDNLYKFVFFLKELLMKNKIAITTESAADLSQNICKEMNLTVIPLNILIGEEEYKDGIDLTAKELYKKSELYDTQAKTSGVSPFEYKEVFEKLVSDGLSVIHIALSSKISSCFQNATAAAKDLQNVYIVDSLNLSAGMAMLAIKAAAMRDEGKTAEEIVHTLEATRSKISTSFILEDTDFLYKGGRCSAIEKFSANLFGVRPSVDIIGGKLMPGKKYSDKKTSARTKYIDDKLKDKESIGGKTCMLNYSDLGEDEVKELVNHIEETSAFENVVVNETGCCISAHCGKGCMGIIFERA